MKVKFYRKLVHHKYGITLMRSIDGNESYRILWDYLERNIQNSVRICEMVIDGTQKVKKGEEKTWEDEGNGISCKITLSGVEIHNEYVYLPNENTLKLSLEQFEKVVISWKKFIEDESLKELQLEL